MIEYPIVVYEERKWRVYVHVNKQNNKKYVGITSQNPYLRWGVGGKRYGKNNKKTRSKFWNAIEKYGWDMFDHIIIDNVYLHVEAKNIERILIKYFDSKNNGYNMTDGGDGSLGCHPSEETRKKIGFAARRENLSPETRRKLHKCHLRENLSLETRRKISEASKARTTGFIKGSKHTKEARDKIKKSRDKYRKSVICLNSLEIFADVQEAAATLNMDYHPIRNNCRGVSNSSGIHPVTHERLHWMYTDNFNKLNNFEKNEIMDQYYTGSFLLSQ